MYAAHAKWLALPLTLVATLSAHEASAQYVRNTTLGFESFCSGTRIPDSEFTSQWPLGVGSQNTRPVAISLFASCGIESISQGAGLEDSAFLFRPSRGQSLLLDPLQDVTDTALIGNIAGGVGLLNIVFRTPVNELSLRVVDVEDPDDPDDPLVFELEDDAGNPLDASGYTFANDVVTFTGTFPVGVKRIRLDYGGDLNNWALDSLQFNTWSCGDAEPETAAANPLNPSPEDCDESNGVECDGCRTDCTFDVVGCLVDGDCVEGTASGTIDPESGGCASCTNTTPQAVEVVGYPSFVAAATPCDDEGLTCTSDLCDGAGSCDHVPVAGACAVGGVCFEDGDENPDSQCQLCDATAASTSWTNRTMGTSCDDGNACTDLTPDDDADEGDVCNDQGECVGGEMLDCDDGLPCTVDTCNRNSGCVFTLANGCLIPSNGGDPVCRANGELNPDDECESCQPSADDSAWSLIEAGDACGDPSCSAGVLTPAPTCNASGECVDSEPVACDGAVCADTVSCTGGCSSDAECLSANYCEAGECVPEKTPGESCTRAGECASGFCTDGVCCDDACDGACEACALAGNVGSCTPYEARTDPENECPKQPEVQICDGNGSCVDTDAPDGTVCSEAGECESGNCVDGVCCDAPCDGVCEACNVEGRVGLCEPYALQTDPEDECEQACNGAGECVQYEVRGNGFCTAQPWSGAGRFGWLGGALLSTLGLLWVRRRRLH